MDPRVKLALGIQVQCITVYLQFIIASVVSLHLYKTHFVAVFV